LHNPGEWVLHLLGNRDAIANAPHDEWQNIRTHPTLREGALKKRSQIRCRGLRIVGANADQSDRSARNPSS
jgi:hypothetical protein